MVERICPQCQHGNPLDNRYCGSCGSPLERSELARRQEESLTIAGHQLPVQLKQMGTAVALSLAALAAEAGMAWLRRKVIQINAPEPVAVQPVTTQLARPVPAASTAPAANVVTILSQRVVEVWEQGSLTRQTVERNFWRREG